MEDTSNKHGVWIVENPTEERIKTVQEDFEKIEREGGRIYNPLYRENRVIIENISDENANKLAQLVQDNTHYDVWFTKDVYGTPTVESNDYIFEFTPKAF